MDIIFKVETQKPFMVAVESIKASCAEVGFGVLWELNFKDKLHEKGLDFEDNFMILEVCNPGKAQKVLLAQRDMGFFLPCKVAVYEHEGKTFIGMPKPTELMAMADAPELNSIALEVETQLKEAIDRAAI
ncbi:MAG TPA: hypothetical protein DCS67_09415 [Clostridiales bacterium UBA8960]|jgi:uncharacterized protein (DUF302 family)|nr:hypothetical protein [Clostridiales bacterium UBA8960]